MVYNDPDNNEWPEDPSGDDKWNDSGVGLDEGEWQPDPMDM